VHEFFGRVRYTYRDFNTGDAFDDNGDSAEWPLIDRWHYRFDLARAIAATEGQRVDYNLTAQIGRQYVEWGSGMVLSDQLYAVKGRFSAGPVALDWLAGVTPNSSVIDFDSSRPSFDGDTSRGFFGGLLTWSGWTDHRPYGFYLTQIDYNTEDESFTLLPILPGNPGNTIRTEFDYNSSYVGVGSTGLFFLRELSYAAEFIYEYGEGLSNSYLPTFLQAVQRRQDISAWAAKFALTWLMRDDNLTRLEFETILASGDDDRDLDTSTTFGGNKPGTRDKAFNAFGFAKTGLAFNAPISNIIVLRAGASAFPLRSQAGLFKNLQVGVDVLAFGKMDQDAPLDEPTRDGESFLGWEPDFFVSWKIFTDLVWNLRYGVFFPDDGLDTDDNARHFLYTGLSYSF
jgi:hypothetical protein